MATSTPDQTTAEELRQRAAKLRDDAVNLERESEKLFTGDDAPSRFITVSDFTRNRAALFLVSIYGLILFGAVYIFVRQGFGCADGELCDWGASSANVLELLKIAVVPVITLVIGYYFGRSDRS